MMRGYGGWKPYVPVATRKAKAKLQTEKLRKKGIDIKPIRIEGRKITRTFWGEAWCDHLESFSDYENRLPRGRTYVRNGSVCHLEVSEGKVEALVSGSSMYSVAISVSPLSSQKWKAVKKACTGRIGSLLELLRGKLSEQVMSVVTDRKQGLFPLPREITMSCSCPDWAGMCKHVAAVLYGVGARLDTEPELLFLLRGVDVNELITAEVDATAIASGVSAKRDRRRRIADDSISEVFGIEVDTETEPTTGAVESEPGAAPPDAERGGTPRQSAPNRPAPNRSPKQPTGESVRALRTRLGMTQGELARLLGVSTGAVSGWEKRAGPLKLHARTAEALARASKLGKAKAWSELRS
jgi:uncharacterized Zn finger protein/DNA-binding XRE family transcriptional regulator